MAKLAKFLQGVAGAAGGAGLNVEEVFSTYLYHSNLTSPQQIVNGIDLSGEGGLVWIANRDNGGGIVSFDSERPSNDPFDERLWLYGTQSSYSDSELQITPNSDGFTRTSRSSAIGGSGYDYDYASWTFRKAPKFFDVVTYTGNGGNQTISHNLEVKPAFIIVKNIDSSENWAVYHKSLGAGPTIYLNATSQAESSDSRYWQSTTPTSTEFYVGNDTQVNASGDDYVAYLFADGDESDAQVFGSTGDQQIFKAGSYTGNGSTSGPEIDLGFEPQFLIIKITNGTTGDWRIFNNMSGMAVGGNDLFLKTNSSDAESSDPLIDITPTGFKITADAQAINRSGSNFIYIAIRRGPMAVPESATDVFAIDQENSSAPYYTSNFPVDMGFIRRKDNTSSWYIYDRLRQGRELVINTTAAEGGAGNAQFDYMDGFSEGAFASDVYSWMWKRAPSYFDVVAYSGTGSARNLSHNLGVAPEMMWIKPRDLSYQWSVYHKDVSSSSPYYELKLNSTDALANSGNTNAPFAGNPTATTIPLPSGTASASNRSGYNYIAYLFASVAGVSKVGSYTGNGSTQNIDCGFSSGARFVLIKAADDGGSWYMVDSARGIVAAEDPTLRLEETAAEFDNKDWIDPLSSGFTITSTAGTSFNASGITYIFYAIA